jgi:hypothetical protein
LWSFYSRENIFTKKFINNDRFNHPPLNPLPSREEKITPPYTSPYLRGGGVGLIPLSSWEKEVRI